MALIAGKSMIERVFLNSSSNEPSNTSSTPLFDVSVVTDSQEIEDHVLGFGGHVVRVNDDVPSGTERVFLAYSRYFKNQNFDLIVNLQGDEPLFLKDDLLKLVLFHADNDFDIATMALPKTDPVEWRDPNKVKLVKRESGQCYYFSRSPIPFCRDEDHPREWLLHVGVYSFRPNALESFSEAKMSLYEESEKLEQLRALDIGLSIGACHIDHELIGVDTPSDIESVEERLK